MENPQQELMFKLSMYEQQGQQLQQQLQAIEHGIVDLGTLSVGLEELKGKEGKEILAPIGNGIFTKSKLLSEELIVDIGGKNFVKKNISDTKKIIGEQITKLESAKNEVHNALQKIGGEIKNLLIEAQGQVQEDKGKKQPVNEVNKK